MLSNASLAIISPEMGKSGQTGCNPGRSWYFRSARIVRTLTGLAGRYRKKKEAGDDYTSLFLQCT